MCPLPFAFCRPFPLPFPSLSWYDFRSMKFKPALLLATSAVVFGTLSCASHVNADDAAPAAAPASTQPATQPALSEASAKALSYSIGAQVGRSIVEARGEGIELDVNEIKKAIDESLSGAKSPYSEEQMKAAYDEIAVLMQAKQAEQMAARQKMMEEMEKDRAAQGEKNAAAGKAYRDENGKKQGVKTTESGLQIETLKEGDGPSPGPTDTVKVHYTGTLIDGTKFDSSVDRGEPIEFPLNRVIRGWTEGVGMMKVGGKARLVIPPELGYGPDGSPPEIPPQSTLVFEVELLGITPANAPATKPAGQ